MPLVSVPSELILAVFASSFVLSALSLGSKLAETSPFTSESVSMPEPAPSAVRIALPLVEELDDEVEEVVVMGSVPIRNNGGIARCLRSLCVSHLSLRDLAVCVEARGGRHID